MEELVENFYSLEYNGNLHSANDTDDSDGKDDNSYQITTLETEDLKKEIESDQIDLEIDKNSANSIISFEGNITNQLLDLILTMEIFCTTNLITLHFVKN